MVTDMSTEPLKIKGKLEISSPNSGSEVWIAGTKPTSAPVQWVRTGSIPYVKIECHDGSTWHTMTSNTSAANLSFSDWVVDNSSVNSTKRAKVRITDLSESSVTDESDNLFLIRGSTDITHPNVTGEGLVVGTVYNITWTKTGLYQPLDNVKIEYNTNNGAYKSVNGTGNQTGDEIDASQGYFLWQVPDDISTNVKIKITRLADVVNVPPAISPQVRIIGKLTVTQPQEGVKWLVNDTYAIKWNRQGSIANVSITYSTDGGNYSFITFYPGGSGGENGTSGYLWNIPDISGIVDPSVNIKVADASDAAVYNISPNFYIIPKILVTSPTTSQKISANRPTTIAWSCWGDVPYVNISYSTNNFVNETETRVINASAPNIDTYPWAVPDNLSNTVKIRISYPNDTDANNLSGSFRIVPNYTVISPYSAYYDKWPVGRTRQVKWNCSSANAPLVHIYYSLDNGTSYDRTIAVNVSNAYPADTERTHDWQVLDQIGSGFRVQIQDADGSRADINATSPYSSKIIGYFNVTYPDGGEILNVDEPLNIQWDKDGSVTNVKLDISKESGFGNATVINASTSNDGSYDWAVPDLISNTVRVRVSDVNDAEANDTSANYFKIRGILNVISPANADRLPIGYNTSIIWNTTGNITKVNITAYSAIGESDPRFNYTVDRPLNITLNYNNNGNNQTNRTWSVPDNATNYTRIRVSDANDPGVWAESSGNFSIIGSFRVISPDAGEIWTVGETRNITWQPTGQSITEAKITYSTTGSNGPWYNIVENWGTENDSIVDNNHTLGQNLSLAWVIPNNISSDCFIKIEDPRDSTVNDTSNASFKIRGNFIFSTPTAGARWVAKENKTISWGTTGTIDRVNIIYSRNNFTTNISDANLTNITNINFTYWIVQDPLPVFGINSTLLPVLVKMRIMDVNDSTVYADSPAFYMDYYNITWYVRDFLSNLPIGGNLTVNCSSGWFETQLPSPITHKTPFGSWSAAWSHDDYGGATKPYTADYDKNVTVLLESKVVHVWEAKTEFAYTPSTNITNDSIAFKSYLLRDGSMAGQRNETTGEFFTIAENCSIEIYNPTGGLVKQLNATNRTEAGFFNIDWNTTNLTSSIVYNGITQIDTALGGRFRTPFLIDIGPTVALYNVTKIITERIDVPLSVFQANMTQMMQNQTNIIESKMNQTVSIIENKTDLMITSVNTTLSSFENRTYTAISALQAGANQTLNASEMATAAALELGATARKFSWRAGASPDPVLAGEGVTISCQGPPDKLPILSIYSWDNKAIVREIGMAQTQAGLYQYEFIADSRFTPGKAYTFVIYESDTDGLVTGSGMVESISITTIAGLAAAAPEAERAAKNALDAIKAVEAVLVTGENINIGLTLKNLKESIDALPGFLSKEMPSEHMGQMVNEIAERLKVLAGDEGYDFQDLLEEALGTSPAVKEVRNKTEAIRAVVDLLLQIFEAKFGGVDTPIVSTAVLPGSIIFRVVAVNPSKTKTQKIQVKSYLPQEIKARDVVDIGGLDLEYDPEKAIYYVYKADVELAPAEVRVFEVEVEDVWIIAKDKLDDVKTRVDSITARVENTDYYPKVKEIADTIYPRLEEIATSQVDDTVSRTQHIGIYRQNTLVLDQVKEDIAKMEKILATAGGPLAPEMLAKTRVKSESPSKTMTWIVIFTLIIFTGLMAGVLFFTWHRQARITKEALSAAKKSAFPGPQEGSEEAKSNP